MSETDCSSLTMGAQLAPDVAPLKSVDLTPYQPALPAAPQAPTPATLLQMAVHQGANLDTLERLMDLQERWEANEARKAYVTAMTKFKAEPLVIFKKKAVGFENKDGDWVGYMHAELSDVTDVVVPAMAKHQLSHRWDVKQDAGRITVKCIVTHALGHSESVEFFGPADASGKKNAIQQIASTTTYFERYSLLAVLGMATTGMDNDGESGADPSAEGKRARWLEDQLANIESARNVKELRQIMEYALNTAKSNNDKDMEHRLIAARDAKLKTAQPANQGAPA